MDMCIWELTRGSNPWYRSGCNFRMFCNDKNETLVHEFDFCPGCGKKIDKKTCGKAGQKWYGWKCKHKGKGGLR